MLLVLSKLPHQLILNGETMIDRTKKPYTEKDFDDEVNRRLAKRVNRRLAKKLSNELSRASKQSAPSPPYYYKDEPRYAYHWHKECSRNHYPNPGWVRVNKRPSGREQCNECKRILT